MQILWFMLKQIILISNRVFSIPGKFGLDYFWERRQLFSKPNPEFGAVSSSTTFPSGGLTEHTLTFSKRIIIFFYMLNLNDSHQMKNCDTIL
jgi:hypothetical protein